MGGSQEQGGESFLIVRESLWPEGSGLDSVADLNSHLDSWAPTQDITDMGAVQPPFLALKHAEGLAEEQPVFFSVTERKAINNCGAAGDLTPNISWATPQGWAVIRDAASSTTYLLDPHSRDRRIIPLPHLPQDGLPTNCNCLLSDYPAAADDPPAQPSSSSRSCLVLLSEPEAPMLWYCTIGGDSWVNHEYDIGTLDLPDLGEGCCGKLTIRTISACQGKFYFNGDFEEIGVLEFCPTPVISFITIRDPIPSPFGFQKVFLVESEQELYMVSLLSHSNPDIVYRFHVHKMDFSSQEWREVNDIGGRVFLLASWYFGASRSADECGLERNCIYVPYPWNRSLKVFNVRDGTEKVLDLDEAPVARQALWMLPTHP